MYILLVDDHADSTRALAFLLNREGHITTEADSFSSAVEAAEKQQFDLLLCDIELPDGDGCTLLRRIRDIQPLPAIATTGHNADDDIQRYHDSGFDFHLIKPFSIPILLNAIQAIQNRYQTT